MSETTGDRASEMRHWAREFLKGQLSPDEFASSMWHLGSQTDQPDDWVRFAHFSDDLGDLHLGKQRAGVTQDGVKADLRREAMVILGER